MFACACVTERSRKSADSILVIKFTLTSPGNIFLLTQALDEFNRKDRI